MKLVEFVPPVKHPLWKLCLQMGITDVIVKVNPTLTGLEDPWRYETLKKIVDGLASEGLKVVGLEGDPFDMTPIKEYGVIGQVTGTTGVSPVDSGKAPGTTGVSPDDGDKAPGTTGVSPVAARETALAHYRELLESMAKLGIKLLCYNFMVGPGWSRTGVRSVRGGALATYFNKSEYEAKFLGQAGTTGVSPVGGVTGTMGVSPVGDGEMSSSVNGQDARCPRVASNGQDARCPSNTSNGQDARCPRVASNGQDARCPSGGAVSQLTLTKEQVWANYEYFIKAVMPTAEKCGVRMGLHPDDPCLPSLGGYARILETVADYDRAYALYPSESNAVTYCQANFKLMLGGMQAGTTGVSPVGKGEKTTSVNGQDARCPSNPINGQDARCPSAHSPCGNDTQGLIETAKHFGKRIAFIHVRDVEGDKTDFTELFHDQGTIDQFALMRTYRALGLDVPVRGDHVPEMEGDRKLVEDAIPGYFNMGRLFANGYLKALLKGTGND